MWGGIGVVWVGVRGGGGGGRGGGMVGRSKGGWGMNVYYVHKIICYSCHI